MTPILLRLPRRLFLLLSIVPLAAITAPPPAAAAETTDITIEVFAARRDEAGFSGPAKRYASKFSQLGYRGARLIDTLTAKRRPVGSSVRLQFRDPKGKEQTIVVKVDAAGPNARFDVSIPAYKFRSQTRHVNGGTFMVVLAKQDLFLAVRP